MHAALCSLLLAACTILAVLDHTQAKPFFFGDLARPNYGNFHDEDLAVFKASRSKRSFDRLDASPFGFSAYARSFYGEQRQPYAPRAAPEAEEASFSAIFGGTEVPRKRLRYNLSDGYLFG
ncbi:hypothetical protein AAVH_35079 [Aphelenchoides avenae]|nr:hypothetical protein AAVH_35079 [Aphelenchus avenae]